MKTVNLKWLAFKYKLAKKLNASIENDKKAIKEGTMLTFDKYCDLKIVECTRQSWSKEAQEIADKYLTELGHTKQETKYLRIDLDNIPNEIDEKVDETFNILENNTNDKIIKRVAIKVANIK